MKKHASVTLFTTIIAVIAFIWYEFASLDTFSKVWALPFIAVLTALCSISLPSLMRRWNVFYSIVATGWTLLVFTVAPSLNQSFWVTAIELFIIAIITEILVRGPRYLFGDIILDIILSIIATWIIRHFSDCMVTTFTLLIMYAISLLINLSFSVKKSVKPVERVETEIIDE